jgi:hypothetical protein
VPDFGLELHLVVSQYEGIQLFVAQVGKCAVILLRYNVWSSEHLCRAYAIEGGLRETLVCFSLLIICFVWFGNRNDEIKEKEKKQSKFSFVTKKQQQLVVIADTII